MTRTYGLAICMGIIAAVIVANTSEAQQRGFRSQAALILSDALLLDQETTDKVVAAYQEVSDQRREEMRNSGQNFRDMSDDERTKYFEEYQSKMAAGVKEGLADVLPENELAEVEAILAVRGMMPVPEMRALRLIELKDDQREALQPATIALAKKIVPAGGGFFGAQMDSAEREAAEEVFAKEKESFIAKVTENLDDDQEAAWKEKAAEVQEEFDGLIEQRRNFQRNN